MRDKNNRIIPETFDLRCFVAYLQKCWMIRLFDAIVFDEDSVTRAIRGITLN